MDKMIIVGGSMIGKIQKIIESISKEFEKKGCPVDIARQALTENISLKLILTGEAKIDFSNFMKGEKK